jgi:DNA-binding SARP family transcriptional activator
MPEHNLQCPECGGLIPRACRVAAEQLEFRILGPLEVAADGWALGLVGRRQRLALAVLLLSGNQTVSDDRLIDALWGERPPTRARAGLHNVIAELRRLLGPTALIRRPSGYLLRVAPNQLDASRFEQLRRQAAGCPPAERVRKLEQALSLWRGRALSDLFYEEALQIEIRHLEESRVATLEQLSDARLESGATDGLVGDLQSLVELHPYRENLRRLLMIALHRSGRSVEAWQAFLAWSQTLDEQLGAAPSDALTRAAGDIRSHRLNPETVFGTVRAR